MYERFEQQINHSGSESKLSIVEFKYLPFEPKRVYWISNMTSREPRGFHSHKKLNQLILVLKGRIRLKLYRGKTAEVFELKSGDPLLSIPPGTWREIYCLEEGSLMLVLADSEYEEGDYIRDWEEYLVWFSDRQ